MCTVLGVTRSTYYKYFNKTKYEQELENEKLKAVIKGYIRGIRVNMVWLEFIIYFVQKDSKYP